jgi:hypothetical protein
VIQCGRRLGRWRPQDQTDRCNSPWRAALLRCDAIETAVDCRICNSFGSHIRTADLRKIVLAIRVEPIRSRFSGRRANSWGHKMVRSALCFALISSSMIGAALCLGANKAPAAGDCITESNLVPPKESHWHYDIDRATNRTCWHIMPLSTARAAPHTRARRLDRSDPAKQASTQRIRAGGRDVTRDGKIDVTIRGAL